jgi:peptidoglycan/LPS O-acetylase OafA/YrhL
VERGRREFVGLRRRAHRRKGQPRREAANVARRSARGHPRQPDVSWSHRPALDGIRTIAVYLVVLFHSGLGAFGGGYIGVDLFFVLSGFLLTNVILSDVDENGTLRFGWFYGRRVRRLLPAAVFAIVVISCTFLLITSVVRRLPLVDDARSALLYFSNWHFLGAENDYFAADVDKSPFLHFWSLSVEEQFYLVYPALLLVLMRFSRRSARPLYVGLGALFAISLASQVYWWQVDPNHAFYGSDARFYQLLAGALLACALRSWAQVRFGPAFRLCAPLGLAVILVFGSGLIAFAPTSRGFAATIGSLLLIAGVMIRGEDGVARTLGRPTPAYLGRISYGTYLWHWPVILVIREFVVLPAWVLGLSVAVIATGLAALSYELLEMPIRRAPALNRRQWQTVAAGLAASVLAAVLVGPVLSSDRRPVVTTRATVVQAPVTDDAWAKQPVPRGLDWEALANDRGIEWTCPRDKPDDCIVVRGSGPHIALVGDSQARVLMPVFEKLAREHGLTLSASVLEGCPWQAGVRIALAEAVWEPCREARDDWYRQVLPELDADVVFVISQHRDSEFWSRHLQPLRGPTVPLAELLRTSTEQTAQLVTSNGAQLVMLDDMLETRGDPLDCLATADVLGECAVPISRKRSLTESIARSTAAVTPGVTTFDVNPIVCPNAPVCAPMIAGINVWRNNNHFSTQIFLHFRDELWQAIERLGVLSDG